MPKKKTGVPAGLFCSQNAVCACRAAFNVSKIIIILILAPQSQKKLLWDDCLINHTSASILLSAFALIWRAPGPPGLWLFRPGLWLWLFQPWPLSFSLVGFPVPLVCTSFLSLARRCRRPALRLLNRLGLPLLPFG